MATFSTGRQMIYSVSIGATEVAGIVVSGQYISTEILIAVYPADGSAIHYDSGMFSD